jgi:hypothetical protein
MSHMKELYKYMHACLFVSRNKWVLFLSDSCKQWLIICKSRKYLAVPPAAILLTSSHHHGSLTALYTCFMPIYVRMYYPPPPPNPSQLFLL